MQTNTCNISAQGRAACHKTIWGAPRATIALFIFAIALLVEPALAQAAPSLFATDPAVAGDGALTGTKAPKGYKRARLVKIDPAMLQGPTSPLRNTAPIAADGPKVSLNLFG